jgi:hypothetical protein
VRYDAEALAWHRRMQVFDTAAQLFDAAAQEPAATGTLPGLFVP